jgi:hypothetical protein
MKIGIISGSLSFQTLILHKLTVTPELEFGGFLEGRKHFLADIMDCFRKYPMNYVHAHY